MPIEQKLIATLRKYAYIISYTFFLTISDTVSISAKVPRSLKKKIDELDINVSETVREALSDEVERRIRAKAVREIARSKRIALPRGTINKIIREMREEN